MAWLKQLRQSCGLPFLLLIVLIYWTQGFRSFAWMAVSYQLKDYLKLTPSASQFLVSVAFFPWSIKPLYGILSDCIPIRGKRRLPYLVISSILSMLPWLTLGTVKSARESYILLTLFLTLQNLGTAMSDVVIDAMIAEAAREERATFAGDLQSLSWMAMAVGGLSGSLIGGIALADLNIDSIYLFFSVFPALQLFACSLNEEKPSIVLEVLDQSRNEGSTDQQNTLKLSDNKNQVVYEDNKQKLVTIGDENGNTHATKQDFGYTRDENGNTHATKQEFGDTMKGQDNILECNGDFQNSILKGNGLNNSSEKDYSLKQQNMESVRRRRQSALEEVDKPVYHDHCLDTNKKSSLGKSWIISIHSTIKALFQAMRQPKVFRPMLWFFIAQVVVPNISTVMFYYQTDFLHLDSSFVGTTRVVGWGGLIFGTYIYNRCLKHVPLRKIFLVAHVCISIFTLTDVILVLRLNVALGIPDKVFLLSTSALADAVNQFKLMPFLILSGRLCPPGIEGTLFALFMSINNFGSTVSSFFGAVVASFLKLSSSNFDNLAFGICIQSLCALIPICFLFLVPTDATEAM